MLSALLHTFGQTYYTYTTPTDPSTMTTSSVSPAFWYTYFGFLLVVLVLMLASMWKIFSKAGKPGWAAIVPIYNTLVLLEVAGRPWWWILLMFIPIVNVIVAIMVYYDVAKAFGHGVGFLLFLLFLPLIAFPVLAFGKSKYTKPAMH